MVEGGDQQAHQLAAAQVQQQSCMKEFTHHGQDKKFVKLLSFFNLTNRTYYGQQDKIKKIVQLNKLNMMLYLSQWWSQGKKNPA